MEHVYANAGLLPKLRYSVNHLPSLINFVKIRWPRAGRSSTDKLSVARANDYFHLASFSRIFLKTSRVIIACCGVHTTCLTLTMTPGVVATTTETSPASGVGVGSGGVGSD